MKKYMPLNGLRWSRDSGSTLCGTPPNGVLGQAGGGKYAVVITLVGICVFDYILRIKGVTVSLVKSAGLFPVWLIFYVMGVLKAQNVPLPFYSKKPMSLAMLAILLCCLQIFLMHEINGNVVHGIKLSAHIYSFFVVMWIFSNRVQTYYTRFQNLKLVQHIIVTGKLSFFIYLTHYLFIYIFNYIHFPNFWFLRWGALICLSYGMAISFEKVCPSRMKKLFGF